MIEASRHLPDFEQLRAAVEAAVAARHAAPALAAAAAMSVADELQKLAGLVEQGLLSRDEFEAAKAQLLAG